MFLPLVKAPYNRASLLQAFINVELCRGWHPDFVSYDQSLLQALERCFDIVLTTMPTDSSQLLFRMQLHSARRSYLAASTPLSGMLESSLLISRLEQRGEHGQRVLKLYDEMYDTCKKLKQQHMEVMDLLLKCAYGDLAQSFTSQDLLDVGFDDSTHPNPEDYEDSIEW